MFYLLNLSAVMLKVIVGSGSAAAATDAAERCLPTFRSKRYGHICCAIST